jgi:hypothetical protein
MVDVVINQMIYRLKSSLRRIIRSVRNWRVRRGESMRESVEADAAMGSHEKPRYKRDWLKLEAKWMGGEGDCRDVT